MPIYRQGYQQGLTGRLETWTEIHLDLEPPRIFYSIADNLFLRSVLAIEWIIAGLEDEDDSAYITFGQVRKMTGLQSYEITRLCDSKVVRSKGKGKGRIVHAGDIGRHVVIDK